MSVLGTFIIGGSALGYFAPIVVAPPVQKPVLSVATSQPVVYDPPTWAARLVNTQPPQWFSDSAKAPGGKLYGLLYAIGSTFSQVQQGLLFAYDTTYISSAIGGYLDIAAADYYGTSVTRNVGESDSSFSTRILNGFLTPTATVQAVSSSLGIYSNVAPTIIQPWDVSATGRYDVSFFDVPDGQLMGLRYTPNTPFECLVITQFTVAVSGGISALYETIRQVSPEGVALWVQVGYNL